jgi:hypothetical protein
MSYLAKNLMFWIAPEHRDAKFAYVAGAKTLTGLIRAIGPCTKLISGLIDTIMDEMGLDKKGVLRAIAKMWGIKIGIGKEARHGLDD